MITENLTIGDIIHKKIYRSLPLFDITIFRFEFYSVFETTLLQDDFRKSYPSKISVRKKTFL